MKNKGKPLKLHLFLIPSIVIFAAFAMTILVFHVVINQYIGRITKREIDSEFNFFDLYYNADDLNFEYDPVFYDENFSSKYNSDVIIAVHNVILDEENNAIIPGEPYLYTEEEVYRARIISDYFKKNKSELKDNKAILIKDGAESFYLRFKHYYGISDGGFTVVKDDSELAQNYTLVVYANISSILDFTSILYRILIGLMIVFGLISIFVIFRLNRKIDSSFHKLKAYIMDVGNRGVMSKPREPDLEYLEFKDVSGTVKQMSDMIEEAEDKQKQFFQNASHELRTPLMSIQGYAEGIASGVMKDSKKSAEVIMKESEKMTFLVDEILFLSRMDINSHSKVFENLDIKELLYACSWNIKGMADSRNIKIEHEFINERPIVSGDEKQLERAFSNVLSNAIRYADTFIKISCNFRDGQVFISVIDDGEGISKEELPHVFERFYKGKKGHFGIGLSITQRVIDQHKGEVTAESQKGHTEFKFVLPGKIL